ncbi:MAG TPA: hypothetical protein DET40_23670 [Lentisphaeria bacterium]|nr:MAG: hypothetical protein A2X45_23885 [Lentisphaerae bacterium GWF2_50_93]HCE46556.1 hypothetical protein [Lentisphaeria bacterium]
MYFKFFRIVVLTAILFGLSGPTSFGQAEKAVPDTVIVDKGIDIKFVDFAKKIEASIDDGSPDFCNNNMHFELLFDRMMGGRKISDKAKSEFMSGFKKGFNFSKIIAKGISLKLLRMESDGTGTRALFRAFDPDGGHAYFKFLLVEDGNKIYIADLYSSTCGEDISSILSHDTVPMLARSDSGLLGKLLQKETEFSKNFLKISQIKKLINDGDPDTALKTYNELPDCLKLEKLIILLRIQASVLKGADSREYKESLAALKGCVKDGDNSLDGILLNYYILNKDFSKAHGCLDNLYKMTANNDPYLDVKRGDIFLEEGKLNEAEAIIRKGIQREPTMESPYWSLFTVLIAEKKWPDATKTIQSIEKLFNKKLSFADMEKDPEYASLVKTDDYLKWKESTLKPNQALPADSAKKTTAPTKKPRMLEPK